MKKKILDKICKVIDSPMYGLEFYTKEQFVETCLKIIEIYEKNAIGIDENDTKENIISKVKNYVRNFINVRNEYFDNFKGKEDYQYRTTYGALIKANAICTGYTELICILLEIYDINAYTMIATLPYRETPAIHYFVVAEIESKYGETIYIPIDVEREESRKRKNDNFENYTKKMIITYPNDKWITNKIGKNGLGIPGKEYMENIDYKYEGMQFIKEFMNIYKQKEDSKNDKIEGDRDENSK